MADPSDITHYTITRHNDLTQLGPGKPIVLIGLQNPQNEARLRAALTEKLKDYRRILDVKFVHSNEMMMFLRKAIDGANANIGMVLIDGPAGYSDKGEINIPANVIINARRGNKELQHTYIAFSENARSGMATLARARLIDAYFHDPVSEERVRGEVETKGGGETKQGGDLQGGADETPEKKKPDRFEQLAAYVAEKVKDGKFQGLGSSPTPS